MEACRTIAARLGWIGSVDLERAGLRRVDPRRTSIGAAVFLALLAGACREDARNRPGQVGSTPSDASKSYFTDITRRVGLEFVHENGASGGLYLPEIMGAGAALFDFDNDSDLDVYLTNGHQDLTGPPGADHVNRLYRQEHDGRFVDVTAVSGLGDGGYGMGVAIGDIDNDGDMDVYVTNFGPDQLYRNRGDGTFVNVTQEASIDVDGWSCSAAMLDYDRDGFLDIYVTRYVKWVEARRCFDPAGRPDYCGPSAFAPVHDILLHNEGDGTFRDVSKRAGMASVKAASLGVVCDDLNGDGWIDVYVANDAYPNNLWINQGDGTFVDEAVVMGVAYNGNATPEAGMGVVAADFDNDGDSDLFMTHLDRETNTLYRNDGPRVGFEDVTDEAGLAWSSVPYTGFGTSAFDLELDGDLDILLVNGRVYRKEPLAGAVPPPPWHLLAEPNLLYVNDGTGRFTLLESPAATLCDPIEISRGLATGDIDADGDIDVLVTNIKGPAHLYRNDTPRKGHWLIVRAFDPSLNRDAIGARVTVVCGDRRFVRTVTSGSSYLSSSDSRVHFGLGPVAAITHLDVRWPSGELERFTRVKMDQAVRIVRGTGKRLTREPTQTRKATTSE